MSGAAVNESKSLLKYQLFHKRAFWDLILIHILILNTLPIYILFSYFLVFSLTFLVADMKGKPNLP